MEWLQMNSPVSMIQNTIYALPAKSCVLFCDTIGAIIQQSNTDNFTASSPITLMAGMGAAVGGFIRCTSGNITVTLKSIANINVANPDFVEGLWDDLNVIPPSGINPNGPDAPATVINDPTGFFGALQFDAIGESASVQFQLPHTYQYGTDINPHIHVARNDAVDNVGNVEFEANFRVLPLRGTAFAWTGYSNGDVSVQPADGANETGIIEWTLSDAIYTFGISYQIMMAIRRRALTTGSVALTSADVHGKKGQFGSTTEGAL